ncbi:glycosyltransferase N-terminal domain-containing protein [Marinilabiliaceae bacterium ANBcel2]|nr:glycosyltransferase N-terminal domain-containing protein [Marinilabiliaceae bacterium ANBcel2]
MMRLLYNFANFLYSLFINIASLFNKKAFFLVKGRRKVWDALKGTDLSGECYWVHCASLGEFEQGRPVIEALRRVKPNCKIVLSFFSPSGYEVRKSYNEVDIVVYLPADSKKSAKKFISLINPKAALFIKYEYWYHFFNELKKRDIPLYMVSAIFRDDQIFFKWYGGWFKNILQAVTKFFVQDESSALLLKSAGFNNYIVAGDTRFDRVVSIVDSAREVDAVKKFCNGADRVLVAGSTWVPDEKLIAGYINSSKENEKFIIAPHEISGRGIASLIEMIDIPCCRYTHIEDESYINTRVMIVDTIGMLSSLYRYGDVAYIGGGFGSGIHNTVEPAAYGIPVVFGPRHKKFKEAVDLIICGGGFSISKSSEFLSLMTQLMRDNDTMRERAGVAAFDLVKQRVGATLKVIKELER